MPNLNPNPFRTPQHFPCITSPYSGPALGLVLIPATSALDAFWRVKEWSFSVDLFSDTATFISPSYGHVSTTVSFESMSYSPTPAYKESILKLFTGDSFMYNANMGTTYNVPDPKFTLTNPQCTVTFLDDITPTPIPFPFLEAGLRLQMVITQHTPNRDFYAAACFASWSIGFQDNNSNPDNFIGAVGAYGNANPSIGGNAIWDLEDGSFILTKQAAVGNWSAFIESEAINFSFATNAPIFISRNSFWM